MISQGFFTQLPAGLEPATYALRMRCSTNWATEAPLKNAAAYCNSKWPVRESNPGLRRERASSWPLDQQAIFSFYNRGDVIRTRDLCVPNAALYQTEPRLDMFFFAFEEVFISDSYILSRLPKKCKRFFEKNWKSFKKLKKPFKINIFTLLTYISKSLWIA